MKKSLNFLLIVSLICGVVTIILNFSSIVYSDFNLFSLTTEVVNDVNEAGPGNPGSGWYLLFAGGISLLGDFAIGFITVFIMIMIPLMAHLAIITFQGVARLFQIGDEKKWKNITSKVFTILSIITQILLCLVLFFVLISNLQISKILFFVSFAANVTSVVLFIKEFIKMSRTNTQPVINQ